MKIILALLLALLTISPAHATNYTISDDPGGDILDFIGKYEFWLHRHAEVRIEGRCVSACTIVLSIIPNEHICATPNAEFGFHSAVRNTENGPVYAKIMTALMWEMYPDRVIRVLTPLGLGKPIEHPELVYVDAQKIVKPCGPAPIADAEPAQ